MLPSAWEMPPAVRGLTAGAALDAVAACGTAGPLALRMPGPSGPAAPIGENALEGHDMPIVRNRGVSLFVDRTNQQWIVLDMDGNFWSLPSGDNPWEHRRPFQPAEETELEPIPGHYKSMLGLPF
jgi:hypothetical protein